MKKVFAILSVMLALSASTVCAQEVAVATLEHEGDVSVFYGPNALQQAHTAATHGDVITLSAGNFYAVNIEKAVTIRGAGYGGPNHDNYGIMTSILGEISIIIPDSIEQHLTMEGLFFKHDVINTCNLNAAQIKTCWIHSNLFCSDNNNKGKTINCSFLDCTMGGLYLDANSQNLLFSNCVIYFMRRANSTSSTLLFMNCELWGNCSLSGVTAVYKNNVISVGESTPHSYCFLSSTSSAINNIFLPQGNYWGNADACAINTNNKQILRKDFYNDGTYYQPSDSSVVKYTGTDGTVIGIYGGLSPHKETTSTPQITESRIASKTTADGKLSVNIKVEVQK